MTKTTFIIVLGSVILVGGYFLLRDGYQSPTPPSNQGLIAPQTPPEQQGSQPSTKAITVIGAEFSFSPATLTMKAGERTRVTFINNGQAIHNWTIEQQAAGRRTIATRTIGAGESDTVEFSLPAGTYTYFCSVAGHREQGMVGTLKVE